MTVYYDKRRKGNPWLYDFWFARERHQSPKGFATRAEADEAESELKRTLRRQAAGLETPRQIGQSISIAAFAGVYMTHVEKRQRIRRPDEIESELRVILRFWGARPKDDPEPSAPYHDLTLSAPVHDPSWILKYEDWLQARGVSSSRRNALRARISQVYALAVSAHYRQVTGLQVNPFRGTGLRETTTGRNVTLSLDQMRAILQHAPAHLRMAIAIAALAPKLRLANILALQWARKPRAAAQAYLASDLRQIIVEEHKTVGSSGRPLVTPVSEQLRQILGRARARRGRVIGCERDNASIARDLRAVCEAAGVPYGRRLTTGVTFHTVRHSAATMLAARGIPEAIRMGVMGHSSIRTTQGYTHLNPQHEIAPLEVLSEALPIADLFVQPKRVPVHSPRIAQFPKRRK